MVMLAKRTSCSTALRKAKLDLLPVQRDAELRIFAFDPHGNTTVTQFLLKHGNRRCWVALLALSDRDAGIEVGWLAAPRVPTQRPADSARIGLIEVDE